MSRLFCGRRDQHESHALTGQHYCPGRPLVDGEATPYGPADTWPDVESPSVPRRPVDQPLVPVPWIEYGACGYGWGG